MKKIVIYLFAIIPFVSFSQSIGINSDGSMPHNSAMLDIKSTSKGVLLPRLTLIQRNAIVSPATGVIQQAVSLNLIKTEPVRAT